MFVANKNEETFYNIIDKEYIIKNDIRTFVIKNYIDGENIIEKSNEYKEIEQDLRYDILKNIIEIHNSCNERGERKNIIFLNVGRHSKEKNLSMMLRVFNKIIKNIDINSNSKNNNKKIYLLMIGEGKETPELKRYVEENNLEEQIFFLGKKKNPYPYFKISDYIILTSLTEGYPVVFQESMVLR